MESMRLNIRFHDSNDPKATGKKVSEVFLGLCTEKIKKAVAAEPDGKTYIPPVPTEGK
ncbi:MAG: hypothetical protein K2K57_08445 [Oscillospiraceae bacterium]|nr:hypothetical protein [Oscillospiraceae bacterium]